MILAVDFDGTLYDGCNVNTALLSRLNKHKRKGDIVILWTCRDGERLIDALTILSNNGFKPTFVNQNAPQTIQTLGYDPRKIVADVYIDDKAIRVH